MKINDMFAKKINRPIQGVVKVGQDTEAIIKTELDEYVVTKELHEHFKTFFNAYRKGTQQSTDKMGVWISGFFGSGKSHFLKILSYLLGEQLYDGNKAINYFEGKIADSFVMADMQVASDTSADIILFNIDAEADANSKAGKDPIVKVFMKMFNKMQGFCASMPWMADLERQMAFAFTHGAALENNYNLCELGSRGTGKSHIYKEISPNSILVSGGQTTVANLFYNMSNRTMGLVGMWDCVVQPILGSMQGSMADGKQALSLSDFRVDEV